MICSYCEEEIITGDAVEYLNGGQVALHKNCEMRAIIGSVAHVEHRCSCFVPGSTESDPPGMTRREAANAAVKLWQEQQEVAQGDES